MSPRPKRTPPVTRRLLADPARMLDDAEEYDVWAAEQTPEQAPLLAADARAAGPVECLGLVFASDEERRAYFLDILREKLQDPEFRAIEGFPLGEDADILALSDPPYYTACPNPFIGDFIRHSGKSYDLSVPYHRKPYSGDLKTSERHAVYSFHPYHTKVPPEIIRNLIEHYTDPMDVVLDGFCGTGMTGVAARESGRFAVLNDLSPVATFISNVNNTRHDGQRAVDVLNRIIAESERVWGYVYQTLDSGRKSSVNYFVWSDVFTTFAL